MNILVAAIDFGTTYSGWAFSFLHEYKRDPTQVSAKCSSGGKLLSQKTPTTVLVKPDGETLESFGFEAEDKYAELAADGLHREWYYFQRFKMLLMDKIGLQRIIKLEDETGKELPAKTVFSLAIKYLKDDLLKECSSRITELVRPEDVVWVLTVPAIWNDSAKQFMREAGVEAGIKDEQLKIALEPEAASLFCRFLPIQNMIGNVGISTMEEGSMYIVLDAGGGTLDITVHQIMSGGKLKEVHKASGGAWGGTKVDEAYIDLIKRIVGNSVFDKFVKDHVENYLDLMREFEIKKREVKPQQNSKVSMQFPTSLKDLFKKESGEHFEKTIEQTMYAGKITLVNDKIRVDAELFKCLFEDATQSIVDHVSILLKEPNVQNVCTILMVGGFSESKILQDAIRKNFPEKKIVIPREAGLVVLKGAVVFGHDPGAITERVAKYTYGVEVDSHFHQGKHDEDRKYIDNDGIERCRGTFSKHVEIGQSLRIDEDFQQEYLSPNAKSKLFSLRFYFSNDKSPKYVTDSGCYKLGEFTVDVTGNERSFIVSLSFGNTEIHAQAIEKSTGRKTNCTFNFLG